MNKKLLKLLKLALLGPIFPILAVEGDSGEGDESGENNQSNEGNQGNESNENNEGEKNQSTNNNSFSQEDLERIISKRLKKQEKTLREQFEADKKKASMTEIEKANFERDEIRKENEALKLQTSAMMIKTEILNKAQTMNVIDLDSVYQLLDKSDIEIDGGKVTGVDDALKALLNQKPFLLKSNNSGSNNRMGDEQNQGNDNSGKISFNDMIRKAIGR